ncbi:MAG TPA: hypothetical protein VNM48_15640 [Chloroflexota bacterium]|nr:hypothetical protein [Chloroflexota bacterium]
MTSASLEVHTHSYIAGSRSGKVDHSHADGSRRHQHAATGPAKYTIDKDEWYATTGYKGGGRRKFTKNPVGPQLPLVELEAWQQSFKVVFCDRGFTPEIQRSTGMDERHYDALAAQFKAATAHEPLPALPADRQHGGAAVANLALSFDLDVTYEYHDRRQERVA